MPTYDYVCESCGHEFEVFQSMKDPKLTDCPKSECHGSVRRRLGTGAGLIFKGSGFYETDYRSTSYKEGAKKEQGGEKAPGEGAQTKEPKESKGGAAPQPPAKAAPSGTSAG